MILNTSTPSTLSESKNPVSISISPHLLTALSEEYFTMEKSDESI